MDPVTFTPRVTRGEDGKYRWVYEMSLFKNPTVFFLLWKIFAFIVLGNFVFATLLDRRHFITNLQVFGYVFLGMTALVVLGYLFYAAVMGGKYIIEFEMDEAGVLHRQTAAQAKKAKKLAAATVAAGAAGGSLTTIGAGMNAQRTAMYTEFSNVKKVKAYPKRNLIKLTAFLEHNQVYTAEEDFAFVENYIRTHCPNLKN